MKKRAGNFIVVFSLIFLTFIALEACSKKPIPAQQANTAMIDPSSDLKKYSLTTRELPDLDLVFESKLGKDKIGPNAVSGYAAGFRNNVQDPDSLSYKSLSINLQAYNSAEDVKKDFSRDMLPKGILKSFHELSLQRPIGDESFAYFGGSAEQRKIHVLYRLENFVVRLNSVGIGTNSTIRYARLMESKLKK